MSVTASVGSIAAASIALEEALDDAASMDDEEVGPWVAFDAGRIVDILLLVYSFLCTKRMP